MRAIPRNGRNFEYGGEDPLLAGTIVGSEIAGIQSNRIISTTKHYAINDLEIGRKGHDASIDPGAARMSDLLAFQFAIETGTARLRHVLRTTRSMAISRAKMLGCLTTC